jgi:altronate hydrolase
VGTRNFIAIISSVNCSAHVCRAIAAHFSPERLSDYPNIDGVIALAHHTGCGLGVGSPDYIMLQRTLAGMARHPNVGASLLIGLGCESNQPGQLVENCGLCAGPVKLPGCPEVMTIQESGGIRKTVQAGIEAVQALLPQVNATQRTPQAVSELKLALQCGGSDAWSGVTANPLVGQVADEVVRNGGTVVLAETPEIIGAEHLLAQRAVNPGVGVKLLNLVRWWEQYAHKMGFDLESNRSVGNAAGGLTTLYEKSLGATAKAGSTPLTAVYNYAEPVTERGFTFMDSPGYDPVSVTGQVAGGCNLVLFTTGRGSVFGFKPAPSIKICSNSTIYARMPDDMDFNAGLLLEGSQKEQLAADLFELVLKVASGQPSLSEAQGVGESEFTPWIQSGGP